MTTRTPSAGSLTEIPHRQMMRYASLLQGDLTRARRFRGYQVVVSTNISNARRNCRLYRFWRRVYLALEAGNLDLAAQILATGGPQ